VRERETDDAGDEGTRRDGTRPIKGTTDQRRARHDRTNDRARIEPGRVSSSSSSIRGRDETSDEGDDVV
jgi:hypothetical protein